MNDAEYAEFLRREQHARVMGWTRNDYECPVCLEGTGRAAAATYLDWPAFVDREGKAYCTAHDPRRLDMESPREHAFATHPFTMTEIEPGGFVFIGNAWGEEFWMELLPGEEPFVRVAGMTHKLVSDVGVQLREERLVNGRREFVCVMTVKLRAPAHDEMANRASELVKMAVKMEEACQAEERRAHIGDNDVYIDGKPIGKTPAGFEFEVAEKYAEPAVFIPDYELEMGKPVVEGTQVRYPVTMKVKQNSVRHLHRETARQIARATQRAITGESVHVGVDVAKGRDSTSLYIFDEAGPFTRADHERVARAMKDPAAGPLRMSAPEDKLSVFLARVCAEGYVEADRWHINDVFNCAPDGVLTSFLAKHGMRWREVPGGGARRLRIYLDAPLRTSSTPPLAELARMSPTPGTFAYHVVNDLEKRGLVVKQLPEGYNSAERQVRQIVKDLIAMHYELAEACRYQDAPRDPTDVAAEIAEQLIKASINWRADPTGNAGLDYALLSRAELVAGIASAIGRATSPVMATGIEAPSGSGTPASPPHPHTVAAFDLAAAGADVARVLCKKLLARGDYDSVRDRFSLSGTELMDAVCDGMRRVPQGPGYPRGSLTCTVDTSIHNTAETEIELTMKSSRGQGWVVYIDLTKPARHILKTTLDFAYQQDMKPDEWVTLLHSTIVIVCLHLERQPRGTFGEQSMIDIKVAAAKIIAEAEKRFWTGKMRTHENNLVGKNFEDARRKVLALDHDQFARKGEA